MHSDVRWPKREDENRNQPTHRDVSGFETVGFENFAPEKLPNSNRKPDRLKQPPCSKGELLNFEGYIFIFLSLCGFKSGSWKLFSKKIPEDKTLHFQISLFYSQKFDDTTATVMLFLLNCAPNNRNPVGKQTNLFTGGKPGLTFWDSLRETSSKELGALKGGRILS